MAHRDQAPILLIEDDADMRAMVAGLLADGGASPLMACSGREGLARLQATTDHLVVVLSGVLQDMSVAAVLDAIVGDGQLARRHAFVLISPEADGLARAQAWQSQVPLFTLLEPYSVDELAEVVRRAAQCVALSREMLGVPRVAHPERGQSRQLAGRRTPAAESHREAAPMARPSIGELEAARGVLVLGGGYGMRQVLAHLFTCGPNPAAHTYDEHSALAWLRARPDPLLVILNTTALHSYINVLRAATVEARLVRHRYLLLVPTGGWLSNDQRELAGALNAVVIKKPVAPTLARRIVQALTAPPVEVRATS